MGYRYETDNLIATAIQKRLLFVTDAGPAFRLAPHRSQ